MSESAKRSIFISYSRQDQAYVQKLINTFEEKGLSVWLDERIDYGTAWQKVIEDHLRACQVFVLVMTPRSYESHWVQCELSLALELRKPIFPLLLEGERWFSVARIQVVDVKSGSLPPDRFFNSVSTFVVNASIGDAAADSGVDQLNVATTVSIKQEKVREHLEAEDELAALRRELAELRAREKPKIASVDARYADLDRYLKNGQWKEADDETYRLMITEVGKDEGQWFSSEDLLNFPCEPLKAIDGLWVKHSGGKFGFSVQKEMYLECGGIPDGRYYKKTWNKLCEMSGVGRVGYDIASPRGHLPRVGSFGKWFETTFRVQRGQYDAREKERRRKEREKMSERMFRRIPDWMPDPDEFVLCVPLLGVLFSRIQTCEL